MRHALAIDKDGNSKIITAAGKPLPTGDVGTRMFHLLPKLLIDPEHAGHLAADEIALEITTDAGLQVMPQDGIKIRQPYPNQRYFVGGTTDMRNGWLVPIPDGITKFTLTLRWYFFRLWHLTKVDDWEVRQIIHIELQPESGNVYSMSCANWPRKYVEGPDARFSAVARLGINWGDDSTDEALSHRSIIRTCPLIDAEQYECGFCIEESMNIPGVALEQAWDIDAFNDLQLHEVKQTATFKQGNAEHAANVIVDCPANLFCEAVYLAQSIPFEPESDFGKSIAGVSGACERHPANLLLSSWWTENSPTAAGGASVGFAIPWARACDDGEYWCGDREVPNVGIEDLAELKASQAALGHVGLLMFHAKHADFSVSEEGVGIVLADGTKFSTHGVSPDEYASGEFDEARVALRALADFPYRFPAAWEALQRKAGSDR